MAQGGRVPTIAEVGERLGRTSALADDVSHLRYVSGQRREALERLGIRRVRDLLLHVPHRYLDFSCVVPISHADVGQEVTVVGTVDKVKAKRPRPNLQIVEAYVLDQTGVMQATFFRQPWIADRLKVGTSVALSGRVEFAYGFKQMKAPFLEVLEGSGEGGDSSGEGEGRSSRARILPVHPVGEGISASWMRRIVSCALADAGDVCDFLPPELVTRHGLMSLSRALREVHFPSSLATAEEARRRLAYDELLCLQITLLSRQHLELRGITPFSHVVDGPRLAAFRGSLPFSLTGEQEAALGDILRDMAAPHVMNRLLLGDVGTGKTVVAGAAIAAAADGGAQSAMMAPTSVLATQYAQKLGPLLDAAGVRWQLITGATPTEERRRAVAGVASGEVSVTFGTTALLSDDVAFARLGLVVIDEQHRFGVDQRAALRRKGPGADLLAMTATPIPRSLALTIYGDVSCSRISQRPNLGAGVTTKVIPPERLDLAYGAILEAHEQGHQAYVVCPLVDDADDGSELDDVPEGVRSSAKTVHSASTTQACLARGPLKGLSVGLVTGRLSAADKDRVMDDFRSGAIDVLVSTTVIEVGVDVPNATVMLVLDSDRFGLATLHQLRGRVGRGDCAGTVFLECAAKRGSTARKRLSALESTSDGLELAELDLKLRHEGEVLGYRQHGGVSLRVSDLAVDGDLAQAAHEDARRVADADPELSAPGDLALGIEAQDRFGGYFEEVERA